MKKLMVSLLSLVALVGCGNQDERARVESRSSFSTAESAVTEKSSNTSSEATWDFENTVIIYYSLTENTEEVAQAIQEQTGAEIYRLEPVEPYPTSYSEVAGLVRDQQEQGFFPELKELSINLDQYDTIFIGSPTWHGYISQPVQKWLMDTNLSDKNIAPFFTSGSQPIEDPQSDLRELIPSAPIAPELSMVNSPRDNIDEFVAEWLNNLSF